MRDKFLKGILQKNTNIGNNRKGEEFKRLEELFYPVKNAFLKRNEIQTMKGVDTTVQQHQTGEIDIQKLYKKLQKILPILIQEGVDYRYEIQKYDPEITWTISKESFLQYFNTFFNPNENFTNAEMDTLLGAFDTYSTTYSHHKFHYIKFLCMLQGGNHETDEYKSFEEKMRQHWRFHPEIWEEICKKNKDEFITYLRKARVKKQNQDIQKIQKFDLYVATLFKSINVKGNDKISRKELMSFLFDPNYERDVQPKLNKMFLRNTFSEDNMKKVFKEDETKEKPMTYREFKASLRKLGCILPLTDYGRIFDRYCEFTEEEEKRITLSNFIEEAKREDTHTQELD
jgi:hypothetical protein